LLTVVDGTIGVQARSERLGVRGERARRDQGRRDDTHPHGTSFPSATLAAD